MPRFILRVDIQNSDILSYFQHFLNLYYYNLPAGSQIKVDFEFFEHGLLLVYDKAETFVQLMQLQGIGKERFQQDMEATLKSFPEKLFPANGFSYTVTISSQSGEPYMDIISAYFQRLHSDFTTKKKSISEIQVSCASYPAFNAFLLDFITRYSQS